MYTIEGFDPVNFTNEKTGEVVSGTRFHLLADEESSTIKNGRECVVQFFMTEKIKGTPTVGAIADLKFAVRNGKAVMTGIEITN